MSHREVVHTLYHQAKIEPGFTELGNSFFPYFFHGEITIYILDTTEIHSYLCDIHN